MENKPMEDKKIKFFDIELIDVSDKIENFTFSKVEGKELNILIEKFKSDRERYLEFKASEGCVLLEKRHFRGIMWDEHIERSRSVSQETKENSVEISKIKLKKSIFSKDKDSENLKKGEENGNNQN